MDTNKDYYIVPGVTIGAQGLPGGHLEAKKEYLKIDKKFFDIIGPSIDFLMTEKKIIDGEAYAKLFPPKTDLTDKSEKRLALESEAKELGIEFDDKMAQKELLALIEEAKKGKSE